MLEDRYYMRSEERSSRFSASVILMIVLTVVFALQQIDYVYTRIGLDSLFALSVEGPSPRLCLAIAYVSIPALGPLHLAFNLLALWFFGRPVEARLGTGNF
jgi:membrane associated rhomboid family serine protease